MLTLWLSEIMVQRTPLKDSPAGIMLYAAILYSGGTAGKLLRVLSHINVACIKKTFYLNQRKYLQPL